MSSLSIAVSRLVVGLPEILLSPGLPHAPPRLSLAWCSWHVQACDHPVTCSRSNPKGSCDDAFDTCAEP